MLFRPGGIVAAACALLTLGITSCTGKPTPLNTSSAVTSPSASASPTPSPSQTSLYPSDVPLTGKNLTKVGEKPPLYPDAARANSQAGALAFAKFFVQTVDWGYATSDGSYMRHYYDRSCGLCDGIAVHLDELQKLRRWQLGARISIKSVSVTSRGSVTAPADHCAVVESSTTAGDIVDASGKVYDGWAPSPVIRTKLCVEQTSGEWRTTWMGGSK